MAHEWHYSRDGEKHGPVSSTELKELVKRGGLSRDDLVWREGMRDWKPASSVTGLFEEKSSGSPPPLPSESLPAEPLKAGVSDDEEIPLVVAGNSFQFRWAEWNLGGKVIFVSACVALLSMFMKWVDLGIVSANGFSQGAVLFLGFFVYPVFKLFRHEPIHLYGGIGCAVGGILLAIGYMSQRTVTILGRSASLFGTGALFFFIACAGLAFGVYKYQSR